VLNIATGLKNRNAFVCSLLLVHGAVRGIQFRWPVVAQPFRQLNTSKRQLSTSKCFNAEVSCNQSRKQADQSSLKIHTKSFNDTQAHCRPTHSN